MKVFKGQNTESLSEDLDDIALNEKLGLIIQFRANRASPSIRIGRSKLDCEEYLLA